MSPDLFDDEIQAAGRLVSYGFLPRARPARDADYEALVRRYCEDPGFAELVNRYASGLRLGVVGITRRAGTVLAALPGSVFETRLEPYARLFRPSQKRDSERVLHGIIHLAAAVLCFPRPADLVDEGYVGRVSVKAIDRLVRDACAELDARATTRGENGDPPEDEPELERVWRLYVRRPDAAETRDDRVAPFTTEALIPRVVSYLVEQGMLTAVGEEDAEAERVYRTTSRYQLQIRELAAVELFNELTRLHGGPPISGGGLTCGTSADGMLGED